MTASPRVQLTREIRFHLPLDESRPLAAPVLNSWSGWPTAVSLAPFLCLRCTLDGPIDPHTDYVCNVKEVDGWLRCDALTPLITEHQSHGGPPTPSQLLFEIWPRTVARVPSGLVLEKLQLLVSPFLSLELSRARYPMVRVSQQFEFSASHRLHNHDLSDEENRRLYGKCNNPHGHGHNYILEVSLELDAAHAQTYSTLAAEQVVKSNIIDRLDHRHLNLEVPPFDRLNPTVENIAVTIWEWLVDAFPPPLRLAQVRVYETPKTWADYCGPTKS